ncbi:MAG: hypothetical protein LBG05_00735 [Treponema sp.]|nr:hypothetical protein [Treponema sp.]
MKKLLRCADAKLHIVGAILTLLACAACAKPLWLTDEGMDGTWRDITRLAPFTETAPRAEALRNTPPRNRYGFIITTTRPTAAGEADEPIAVYPGLYQNGGYGDSLVLALDPWVVFYEFTGSSLARARAEKPGQGVLVLPGAEKDAVSAWTAQFIQSKPSVFSAPWGEELIEATRAGGQFQNGAQTYNWANSWDVFFEHKPSWIYAPYSAIRAMPPIKTAGFEACRFPIPADWESYGVQAAVLWAVPFFRNAKEKAKLETAKEWLVKVDTQKRIADAFNWLPARSDVPPTNALARSVQSLCAKAEFVWTVKPFEK